jgi:hypothetical protein
MLFDYNCIALGTKKVRAVFRLKIHNLSHIYKDLLYLMFILLYFCLQCAHSYGFPGLLGEYSGCNG